MDRAISKQIGTGKRMKMGRRNVQEQDQEKMRLIFKMDCRILY